MNAEEEKIEAAYQNYLKAAGELMLAAERMVKAGQAYERAFRSAARCEGTIRKHKAANEPH